jgi:ATP-dependent RNA helicase DDX35
MTEGVLINEIKDDPLLNRFSILMLDDIHERTVNTDLLLGLMKKIIKKREDLKVLISSATIEA